MSKLAIYDKTHGQSDKMANDLFYRDYVYRKNFALRFAALLGCLIPIVLYMAYLVLSEDMDFFNFDYIQFVINASIYVGIIMVVYTFIGTKIFTHEYKEIKLRLQEYFTLMRRLETLRGDTPPPQEAPVEQEEENHVSYKESLRNQYGHFITNKRESE